MNALLKMSAAIDAVSELLGKVIMWIVLATVIISAGNAIVRKVFNVGSNAYLEIQWYLFAAVFMLGVGYVMRRNGHVRIDFVSSRLSRRTNAIIDAAGIVVFTIPLALILVYLGWPLFYAAWKSGEQSQNAGGLVRWPVLALIPIGFTLLFLQALSELIKRLAFITGHAAEPFSLEQSKSDEELLAEELAAEAARQQPKGAS